jgi:peptide/nickel transport system substrate-binding protein
LTDLTVLYTQFKSGDIDLVGQPYITPDHYGEAKSLPIIQGLYYGVPTPTETFMPRQSFYFNPNLPMHEFNMNRARQILDQAGWAPFHGRKGSFTPCGRARCVSDGRAPIRTQPAPCCWRRSPSARKTST